MSSDSGSWDLWLKLIFALACAMVMIVGIALIATLWTNCKLRRQARVETALHQDQGPLVSQVATESPSQPRTHAHKSSEVRHIDSTWHSRPYSSFGLSYTSSEVSLGSPGSRQTVLLPPRPDAVTNQPPSTSQFQEIPAEEAGYLPASPSILRPYLREDGSSRAHHILDPCNSNLAAAQRMPGSYPPTQRSSYQTTCQHQSLLPNSRYSHMLPTFLGPYQAPGNQPASQESERPQHADHAGHNAMPPRSSRIRFDQDHRRYQLPPLDPAATRASTHIRDPSSEPLFPQDTSPIDSEGVNYTRPEPLLPSAPLISPLQEERSLRDRSLAPLPLSSTRIARRRASSNAETQSRRPNEARPDILSCRNLGATNMVLGSGGKPHLAFLTQSALGPRSVASTAQSQTQREPRKLQKRRPSDGQAGLTAWSSGNGSR